MNKKNIIFIIYAIIMCVITLRITAIISDAPKFDWKNINTNQLYFPKDFLWGAAICEYQNSGAQTVKDSQWAKWEHAQGPDGKSAIINGQKSEKSCDFYNLYKEDIKLLKNELHLNSLRFSIDWSLIEPVEGKFDESQLQHYENIIDTLIANKIQPMVTLHHFVHPDWFEKKGAFEKPENIKYFIKFSQKVFERFSGKVKLWCTINEPNIYAFQGYIRGVFPPGKVGDKQFVPTQLSADVLRNLLEAHVAVYAALKNMPNGKNAQIGLVLQYLQFEPYGSWNPLEHMPGNMLNNFLNDSILEFCKTGNYNFSLTTLSLKKIKAEYKAPISKFLDFIGLNYYSRVVVAVRPGHPNSTCFEGEIMTDMPYAIYAEGLYKAIKKFSQLNLPIYITENGISDAKDDRRELFIRQYLYAMSKAIKEGADIRGYYYWSLMDNFEWDMGYTQKFGLCSVDFNTKKRTLRNGAKYFAHIVKNAQNGLIQYKSSHVAIADKEADAKSSDNKTSNYVAAASAGILLGGLALYTLYNEFTKDSK